MTMLAASKLLDPAVLQDPYHFYATLREEAPVWAVPGTGVVADQIAGTAGGEEAILLAVRRALDAGALQMGEATVILHTLLSAGGESTTSLLGNAVRMLAEDLTLQQRLRENPKDVDLFVEEALRLESPFRQMMRSVPHDTELGGTDIPWGSTVLLLFAAANRDPAQFDHPDQIDLARASPKRHLAFGHGIHFCVGAALARIETRAVLNALLEQTLDFSIDPAHAPRWVDSLLVRRHAQLRVCATPGEAGSGRLIRGSQPAPAGSRGPG